ncbi:MULTISPECIES: nuclear transport factor 2-like protein [Flavobacterium]|uniref:Nuclear transport factor 2 family protein n=1 Tax=Flavobacterium gawalongense TaxID=2594432 RepID=A0A553BAC2_9FLAO|nr:nuclear transport factor 2 family protein [Flavobacterium gawalongense]TRW96979.1 nuclear transport factor 2 family protein [Flavobacterium gawalongense]TRX01305.1 nuclear transport factor 2 family protein [Flavobacterium gawalongense]TRX05186.1 nuclear transport factor 2 family protein [Flavobacterium gawalongense]TRX06002.1 nuclear transport factor 2 family protein [Flavobacterium gawalongense]TRX21802.1 nuclear transport factor 2 family protein [Flavobacterium gawalongense]
MSAKEIVQKFYKSDALIDSEVMKDFLHPDIIVEWNSSKGFIELNYDSLLNLANDLSKAYVRSKVRISHIIAENDLISVRYSHFVKTIENPREEMLLAHFIAIWQIKDNKLFRGYQMSQLS